MLGSNQPELMEYRAQNRWAIILATVLILILASRFFYLQIFAGEKYEKLAKINQIVRTRIPAERGEIRDRNGGLLAGNIHTKAVSIVPHFVEDLDAVLSVLQEVLELSHERVGALRKACEEALTDKDARFREIRVSRSVIAQHCPADASLLETREPEPYLWCPVCGTRFDRMSGGHDKCPYDNSPLEKTEEGFHRCPKCERRFASGEQCPVDGAILHHGIHNLECPRCAQSYSNQAAVLEARLHDLRGVELDDVILRGYPHGALAAHMLGYMNQVTRDDLDAHPGFYRPGDNIGRRGIERSMEEVLRGRTGEQVYVRSSGGQRRSPTELGADLGNLRTELPVPGNNVVLTIDVKIQGILQEALAHTNSAAAVVLDVRNGEVLGIVSHPTFDSNVWSGRLTRERKARIDENPYYPMVNKATVAFPPASTFKMITTLAALNEGIGTADTVINCPGFYDFSDRRFHCFNRYGHGDLDLLHATIGSCDVYFYRLGEWLGIDRLEQYATLFGLGVKTGVEIGESAGLVPSRAWHESHSKGGFRPGFTLSTAVGQKDIRATPLQMAMVTAQVVNGGKVIRPHLVHRIEDRQGNVLRVTRGETDKDLGIPQAYLDFVRDAMVQVVESEDGTAYKARLASIRFGAKTGTAEAREVKPGVSPAIAQWLLEDHAWMVAFAPAEAPRISVVVFVEHGGFGGSVAGPIVSRIIYRLVSQGLIPGAEGGP
ncbi:MAG: penicillin-binding protein 2 [Pseudomonadota bacterium]